ncbi:hypothetical protein GCK32_002600 [Trichostrongylus colubriformis]|uniref:Uncharacterized protein n=1 Tax=Trichostrongylus colubriformis TaxID=6319 RepID=A0AAN8F7M8_TRICO
MLPFRDENVVEMEEPLDTPQQVRENDTISEFSILSERCNDALVSMYKSVMERLSDSRVTKEKRMEIEKEIKRELGKAVLNVLEERGITTVGDWMDYIRTTERDGDAPSFQQGKLSSKRKRRVRLGHNMQESGRGRKARRRQSQPWTVQRSEHFKYDGQRAHSVRMP